MSFTLRMDTGEQPESHLGFFVCSSFFYTNIEHKANFIDLPVAFWEIIYLLVGAVTVNAEWKGEKRSLAGLEALLNDQSMNFFIINKNRQI